MKKVIATMLALTLLTPAIAFAHPGGWGPQPHWGGPGPHWRGPGPYRFLPDAATAVLIGGLTYYMMNGAYYQRHGNNYVVVQPPEVAPATPANSMRVLDFNGRSYYVQQGHYYQREIGGEYVEVPRPAGL